MIVLIGSTTLLLIRGGSGTGDQRSGGGHIQFVIHRGLTLQPFDFLAQGNDIRLHLFIGGVVFRRDHAIFIPVTIQESFGLVPQGSALFAQRENLVHCDIPPSIIQKRQPFLQV